MSYEAARDGCRTLAALLENGIVSLEDLVYELDYRSTHAGYSASDSLSNFTNYEIQWGIDWMSGLL